jgi:para-nitrobenzyl esterase
MASLVSSIPEVVIIRLIAIAVSILASMSAHALEVQTKYGSVRGTESQDTAAFKGIPYAASPTGVRRWAAPTEPDKWQGVRNADQFSPKCPQASMVDKSTISGSEDCLYLNIFRPLKIQSPLPVMVFIHGGGNTVGASSDEMFGKTIYDGSRLAGDGSVVVTFNYRLGALGFLAHPDLKAADGLEGNYALLDQIQVLKFVKENIAAFGGDPQNVTLFGESAGAINALVLLASPRASGLFDKAIIESGFINELSLAAAEKQGTAFAQTAGCLGSNVGPCLRSLPVSDILAASGKLSAAALGTAGATIDGVVLKQGVLETIAAGQAMHIPLVIGTNSEEMRTLLSVIANLNPNFTAADYSNFLKNQFGSEIGSLIEAEYPAGAYATPRLALEDVLGDQLTQCPTRAVVRAALPFQPLTFRYVFSHVGISPVLAPYGAGHGLEMPYVFGNMAQGLFTQSEFQLSAEMRHAWVSFANTGTPQVSAKSLWPSAASDSYMNLDLQSHPEVGFHSQKCDFWDHLTSGTAVF